MASTKQKQAARKNLEKARAAQHARAEGKRAPARNSAGMSTSQKNDLPDSAFAFPEERKEPLTDARHVRNAVARFQQVEGVSDAERDRAWQRIRRAADRFDVELSEQDWREIGR
ncbi:MAG TPA: DUF6582 domain-containing protein [Acidimicrobiales bacterium]|nr:DUF6582 domain-containing protein [Acidimicrobiales bacterium]